MEENRNGDENEQHQGSDLRISEDVLLACITGLLLLFVALLVFALVLYFNLIMDHREQLEALNQKKKDEDDEAFRKKND